MAETLKNPVVQKLLLVAGAAALAILGTQYPEAARMLDGLAGLLTGKALMSRPGDVKAGAE